MDVGCSTGIFLDAMRQRDWETVGVEISKGGILVMVLPNWESLDHRLFGRAWIGFDAPRHLAEQRWLSRARPEPAFEKGK